MSQRTNEITISLKEVFLVFWKRLWVLILAAVVFTVGAVAYVAFTTRQTYKATARICINNSNFSFTTTSISLSDLNASSSLVPTYSNLAKAEYEMLETVLEKGTFKGEYTYDQLVGMISCVAVKDTSFLDISVTSEIDEDAIDLAMWVVQVLPSKVESCIEGSSVALVDPPRKAVPVGRGWTKSALIGFVIGLIFAALVVFILDVLLDDRFENDDWLKSFFGEYPVLAVIPDVGSREHKHYGYYQYYYSSQEKKDVDATSGTQDKDGGNNNG